MTYSNPRLKHVKSIEMIAKTLNLVNERLNISVRGRSIGDLILDQCNLLLETKKAKKRKCDGTDWVDIISDDHRKAWRVNHVKKNCFVEMRYLDKTTTPDPKEESKKAKKKKCRICGKKISLNLDGNYHEESLHRTISVTDPKEESKCDHNYVYADIPNGEDGNYCTKCKQAEPEYTPTESKEKICNCRGNGNANNVDLPCSSCGGINPMKFTPSRSEVGESSLETELVELLIGDLNYPDGWDYSRLAKSILAKFSLTLIK